MVSEYAGWGTCASGENYVVPLILYNHGTIWIYLLTYLLTNCNDIWNVLFYVCLQNRIGKRWTTFMWEFVGKTRWQENLWVVVHFASPLYCLIRNWV